MRYIKLFEAQSNRQNSLLIDCDIITDLIDELDDLSLINGRLVIVLGNSNNNISIGRILSISEFKKVINEHSNLETIAYSIDISSTNIDIEKKEIVDRLCSDFRSKIEGLSDCKFHNIQLNCEYIHRENIFRGEMKKDISYQLDYKLYFVNKRPKIK